VTVLVVAKAPVPALAKTRLAASVGADAAAAIAAAALLDTLDAVAAAPVSRRVVAVTGDLTAAARGDEIRRLLNGFTVIAQRGADFADRLANAHVDAADSGPVLQIGMDTPQVTAELIARCADTLSRTESLLGMAWDGGWWALGLRSPEHAAVLRDVPMSRSDTGALTLKALRDNGVDVTLVEELRDVDTIDDIGPVRSACSPESRFAKATRALLPRGEDQVVEQKSADDVDTQPPAVG
jgi:uncharacterized protein